MDGQQVDDSSQALTEEPQLDKSQTYWATWTGKDLAQALDDKQDAYFQTARARGLLALWIIAYAAHHGLTPEDLRDFATQQIGFVGNELEQIRFHINVVRGYIRQQTTLALGDRAAFKAIVVNSDHQSQAKSEIADSIVNALYKRYVAPTDPKVAESDGVFGSGATHFRWDFTGGDDVTVQTPIQLPDGTTANHPTKQKSGAPTVTTVYPWSLVQETHAGGESLWHLVREPDNKWNVIAQFQHLRDQILQVSDEIDRWDFRTLFRLEDIEYVNKDRIVVKHFYHAPCAALPEGRYVIMYGDVLLWDGQCPTKEGMPVSVMRSGEFIETTFGYADAWDMLAIQQALNQVNSDELQNYSLFGRQSIAMEQGTKVTIDAIAKGTAFFVPPKAAMPQAVQLTAVPTTLPNLKDYLHKMLDLVSGQNAASRGDPDPNVRSGEMNALLDAIAMRYQSFRQEGVRNHRIRNATIVLNMIDRYGQTPFFVEIAGIDNRTFIAEYTKDDLSSVQRVTIDPIPPIMQSASGRLQIYQQVMQLPPNERAGAYEMIVNGDNSQFMKVDRSSESYIKRENERLVTGEVGQDGSPLVYATPDDDPFKHYPQHVALRERILASDNPDMQAVGRINAHLAEHVNIYLDANPLTCAFMAVQAPPNLVPTPTMPQGNAAFRFTMQTGGGGAPSPQLGSGGGGPQGNSDVGKPPNGDQSSSGAAQRSDQQGMRQTHPSGTPLPQPAQPPG